MLDIGQREDQKRLVRHLCIAKPHRSQLGKRYRDNLTATGTGGRTQYLEFTLSWQHWLSPQITLRPEISFWHSIGTPAFDASPTKGIAATKFNTGLFAADIILHF